MDSCLKPFLQIEHSGKGAAVWTLVLFLFCPIFVLTDEEEDSKLIVSLLDLHDL